MKMQKGRCKINQFEKLKLQLQKPDYKGKATAEVVPL